MNDMRDSISEWKICIPSDIDRAVYIKNCFLTGTVSIANDNGETVHDVKIGKLALQLVDFPDDVEKFGSDVVCVKAPYSSRLYVMDVFYTAKQYLHQDEDQYRFVKKNGIGTAGVLVDGRGNIIMSVSGEEGNGHITINVTNKERRGKLSINVNGDFLVENDGNTVVKSSTSFRAEFNDGTDQSFIEVTKEGIKLNSNKILLNDSTEPVLLGNKTVDLITMILDQLAIESAGPYPLLGNVKYREFKANLEALKSTITFVK